jgi:hypothetical protein
MTPEELLHIKHLINTGAVVNRKQCQGLVDHIDELETAIKAAEYAGFCDGVCSCGECY